MCTAFCDHWQYIRDAVQLSHQIVKVGSQHSVYVLTTAVFLSSDSGPLRIAKTPSPPEEVSPLPSPTASPNHMLAPASPAPARPKSPTQVSGNLAGETGLLCSKRQLRLCI